MNKIQPLSSVSHRRFYYKGSVLSSAHGLSPQVGRKSWAMRRRTPKVEVRVVSSYGICWSLHCLPLHPLTSSSPLCWEVLAQEPGYSRSHFWYLQSESQSDLSSLGSTAYQLWPWTHLFTSASLNFLICENEEMKSSKWLILGEDLMG